MNPIQAIGVGVALIAVFFMASGVVAMFAELLGPFAPLLVGAVLFGVAMYMLDRRGKGG